MYSPTVLLIALLKTLGGSASIKQESLDNVIGLGYVAIPSDGKLILHFAPEGSEAVFIKPAPTTVAAPDAQCPIPNLTNPNPSAPRTKVLDDRAIVNHEAEQRRQRLAREVVSSTDPYSEQQQTHQNKSFAP